MRSFNRIFLTALLVSALVPQTASAAGLGDFPSCLNPQGTIKASYSEGTHGIVGDRATYTGSDTVYQLDGNQKLLQCFCADNGDGIQTLWYRTNSLSQQDKDKLVRDGWTVVPNGTNWGLDNTEYIAKNLPYACGERATGGGELTDFAGTGNTAAFAGFLASGIAFLIAGWTRIRKALS